MTEVSEFRPVSAWSGFRTACHGCRTVAYEVDSDGEGAHQHRTIVLPGDGTVTRVISGGADTGDIFVHESCPVCGESDTPGWLPGFVPPA